LRAVLGREEVAMRRLMVFNNVSLDGYIADENGDMSWAHSQDPEWAAFTSENASGQAEMLFGRRTYELMAGFWPTPQAAESMPDVARAMNETPKVVFSRTLEEAAWRNTRIVRDDLAGEVHRIKKQAGPDLLVMGSGSIVSQLTDEGLVDEYQVVVHPIVLGRGRGMFDVRVKRNLTFKKVRTFGNGNVVLWYERT
jgi:dihydrofolate reductase